MDCSGAEDVQKQKQTVIRLHSHFCSDKESLVACFDQVYVFSEMFGSDRFLQVLQFNLAELELVVLGVFLTHSCLTVLQTVDLEQAAAVANSHEVGQIHQVNEL